MQFWRHGLVLSVHGLRGVTADKRKSEGGGVCATPDARDNSYMVPAVLRTGWTELAETFEEFHEARRPTFQNKGILQFVLSH